MTANDFHVCSRCGIDTDQGPVIGQYNACALIRGDWLCSPCLVSHWHGCSACQARRVKMTERQS